MPEYLVKAVSRRGETVEALRSAPDEAALLRQLQAEDLLPLEVVPADKASWLGGWRAGVGRRLRQKDVLAFTRELATLLGAGLPLDRSLRVLLELFPEDSRLHPVTARILEQVKGGAQLSAALEAEGKAFSRLYVNMVRAGEAGGTLAQVLQRLADYLQRSQELRASVLSALIYPAILVVMAMADGVRRYGCLALIAVLLAVRGFQAWLADPGRRYRFHRWLLRLPLLGALLIRVEVARFSQTLATLLTSGVALLPALGIVRETLGNLVLREAVAEAAEKLRAGGDISTALKATGHFPVMALQMIRLGEETGQLPQMLERMADIYEDEVRTTVQRMLTLLEPLLIVGLGVVIAAIIVSILMAVVSVNELAF